jgi:thiamine-phosphate pyrophosphorylase
MIVSSKDFDTLKSKIAVFNPDYVLFRDKEILEYSQKAFEFVGICKDFSNLKIFLHQDTSLAKELGACGVHLTSKQFDAVSSAKRLGLEVIISTHTHEEVLEAQRLGADAITYSPVFHSPNKGEPKGIEDLKSVLNICNIKIFALGGVVTKQHIKELEQTNVYGFASIRYFE